MLLMVPTPEYKAEEPGDDELPDPDELEEDPDGLDEDPDGLDEDPDELELDERLDDDWELAEADELIVELLPDRIMSGQLDLRLP